MKRLEYDFYGVELDESGGKVIHVDGYCYHCDSDDSNTPYRHLQFCLFYLRPGFTQEEYDEKYCRCKQYLRNCTEEEIIKIMDDYNATPLNMSDVTRDTPCGIYVDCCTSNLGA